jgi:hypothetical protein
MDQSRFAGDRRIVARGRHITLTANASGRSLQIPRVCDAKNANIAPTAWKNPQRASVPTRMPQASRSWRICDKPVAIERRARGRSQRIQIEVKAARKLCAFGALLRPPGDHAGKVVYQIIEPRVAIGDTTTPGSRGRPYLTIKNRLYRVCDDAREQ